MLKKLWLKIARLFDFLEDKTKRLVPIAIKVVEGIKTVMDGPVDDVILAIIKQAIKGTADDIIIDKTKQVVEEWIPKILLEFKLVDSIANIENQNEQLQAILNQLKLSSDETKAIIYHGLASLILEKLADGEISWSDSVAISEYYFKNFVK
jgi:hypothetical protein